MSEEPEEKEKVVKQKQLSQNSINLTIVRTIETLENQSRITSTKTTTAKGNVLANFVQRR